MNHFLKSQIFLPKSEVKNNTIEASNILNDRFSFSALNDKRNKYKNENLNKNFKYWKFLLSSDVNR